MSRFQKLKSLAEDIREYWGGDLFLHDFRGKTGRQVYEFVEKCGKRVWWDCLPADLLSETI